VSIASSAVTVAPAQRRGRTRAGAAISFSTLAALSALGVAAFLYPFLLSNADPDGEGVARAKDAPLIFALVLTLALLLLLIELSRDRLNAKSVTLLSVVIVGAAVLRIPTLPAGANAFFFLVIIGGYVFGPRLGFLIGSGAFFVSAFITGGIGPWLPFQMFAAGWCGMTAGWFAALLRPAAGQRSAEIVALAAFGGAWGFLFGAIMNLWFWPFAAQGESISWEPGLGLRETLQHYWSFYILTSAGWDAWRAIANAALLLVAGRPVVDLLTRYRDRFEIRYG
jgi:energy-coupling factor transport system substrate-specific component